jgi:hypothetical protein
MLLEPDRRNRAEADQPVDLYLPPVVHGEPQPVGDAADEVVQPQSEHERQPVERDADGQAPDARPARDRRGEKCAE